MRPIHLVGLDKWRPALLLTREIGRPHLRRVTVAPITSTVKGLATEVVLGAANGLDHECAVSCDNVQTISVDALGTQVGWLLPGQEPLLALAIQAAYDLEDV